MKTGQVQDPGDGAEPYLEVDCWTPWQYYVPEEELEPYYRDANALMMKLERMPAAVRARLEHIEIRCPVKGCLLATVYWMPRRPTAEELEWDRRDRPLRAAAGLPAKATQRGHFLYVGRTAGGTEVYDILNYLHEYPSREFPGRLCPNSCILYWQAGCRHGTASIDHAYIHDVFSLAQRCHGPRVTEEEAVAQLPEPLRPFWGKRVFHPEPSAWRPKKRQPRPVPSSQRSQKGAPVLRKGV
jgi:hypothetical protein